MNLDDNAFFTSTHKSLKWFNAAYQETEYYKLNSFRYLVEALRFRTRVQLDKSDEAYLNSIEFYKHAP